MNTPPITALEVVAATLGFAVAGLIILTIVEWLREVVRHRLFLARMRSWTSRPAPPPGCLSQKGRLVEQRASIRGLPPMRGADRRPEAAGGAPLLDSYDGPDVA